MKDFRKLGIWKTSLAMVKKIYGVTATLPPHEKYGLSSQMNRAVISIPSNIAEGCSRNSKIELARYLEIAIGSSFELESQIEVCLLLTYIDEPNCKSLISELNILQRQMNLYRELVRR